MNKKEKLFRIEKKYGTKIKSINDITGGTEPSKLFYLLADKLDYLLDDSPTVSISKKGVITRKKLNILIKKFGALFLKSKQVFEDRESLMYPNGRNSENSHAEKYQKDIELPKEPVIWMANHAFKDDTLATVLAAKRHSYILFGSLPQFYNTLDGVTAYLNGVVMSNRKVKSSKKATIDKAVQAMEYGADLLMFPEGVWNKTPNIPIISLWPGIYRIAQQTGAKIVPVVHYSRDLLNEEKDNVIHTVIDDPIDITNKTEKEALELLRDKMATWYILMMEKYGQSTREKELKNHTSSQQAWEEHLKKRIKTADRYDIEIETTADFKPRNIEDPNEIWEKIANIENITAYNIKDIENAKRLIKENKNNDFQHRF